MEFPKSNLSRLSTAASFIGPLFDATNVFKVQHYQRGIAWDNKKIEEIIEDVEDAMKRGLTEYFIGPITLLQTTHGHYDIIDGQQRLTAISLILTHCKFALDKPDAGIDQSEIQDCLRLAKVVEDILGPTNDPKLHHKDKDEAQNFRDLMARRGDRKKKTHLNAMQRKIDEVLEMWSSARIRAFTTYLLSNVLCIIICSPDKNIAYQIFETLNARGEKLSEIDLIRNRLFRELPDRSVNEKSEAWKVFRQWFVGHYKGASKQISTRMQDVFSIDLNVREGAWVEPKHLYETYVLNSKRVDFDAAEVIDRVCGVDSFTAYIRSVKPWDGCNEGDIRLCSALEDYVSSWRGERELKVMLPLSYAMFMRDYRNSTVAQNLEIAGALSRRSAVVLRTFPVKPLGEIFSRLAKEIYFEQVPEDETPNFLRKRLLEYDLQNNNLLKDEVFVEELSRQTSIDDNKAKDIFIALRNHKSQVAGDRLGKSADLHIEHVLPKAYPDRGWGQFSLDEHGLYKQRLGNLMLLSKKLNEEAKRHPYSRKREYYKESRYLDVAFVEGITDWSSETI